MQATIRVSISDAKNTIPMGIFYIIYDQSHLTIEVDESELVCPLFLIFSRSRKHPKGPDCPIQRTKTCH